MRIVKVNDVQTAWDIAIQEYGSVESVFDLIADNDDAIGLDTQFANGERVKVITEPSNKFVAKYFQSKELKPVSKQTPGEGMSRSFSLDFNYDFSSLTIP
jgi:hypothetical protein